MKKNILMSVLVASMILITACGTLGSTENDKDEEKDDNLLVQEKTSENQEAETFVQENEDKLMVGQFILAPLGMAEGVGVYNFANGELIWEKKHGNNNHGIAYSNKKVYLPNMSENKIDILNVQDGIKIAELKTEAPTHHASQSEKMNEVYVTSNNGQIVIIDGENNKVIDKLLVKGSPYLVFADEENDYLYVTNRNPNVLEVFSLITKEKVKEFTLPSQPSHINVNKNIVAVTNAEANLVSLFDMNSLEKINTFEVGNGAHGVGVNSNYILVANGEDKTLSLIERSTGDTQQINVSIMPNHVSVQKEQFIITDEKGPNIYQLDLNSKELEVIIKTNGPAHQFVFLRENIDFIQSESELKNVDDLSEEDHEAHHAG